MQLIGLLVVLFLLTFITVALCYRFPSLKVIIPLIVGIGIWILSSAWWAGLIAFSILMAIIEKMTNTVVNSTDGGRYRIWCNECESDNVKVTKRDGNMILYHCNNCGKDSWTYLK